MKPSRHFGICSFVVDVVRLRHLRPIVGWDIIGQKNLVNMGWANMFRSHQDMLANARSAHQWEQIQAGLGKRAIIFSKGKGDLLTGGIGEGPFPGQKVDYDIPFGK
jgi:hypothetical protein